MLLRLFSCDQHSSCQRRPCEVVCLLVEHGAIAGAQKQHEGGMPALNARHSCTHPPMYDPVEVWTVCRFGVRRSCPLKAVDCELLYLLLAFVPLESSGL